MDPFSVTADLVTPFEAVRILVQPESEIWISQEESWQT